MCPCGKHDPEERHPTPPVRWIDTPLTAAQLNAVAGGASGVLAATACIHGVSLAVPCPQCGGAG